tara:strand:+ start:4912 stop:5796 length:885 start_codon:yes stop_codon:yes gene_type:complete
MKLRKNIFLLIVFSLTTSRSEEIKLIGEEAFLVQQKMICGTTEKGKTRYGIWEGKAYSHVPGEKDRHLFNITGINVRQCITTTHEIRGRGFRSVSREIQIYLDPKSNEIIDQWKNPWTNEVISVFHVANDPVNMQSMRYEYDERGESTIEISAKKYDNTIASSTEIPLFYNNALGGNYQKYIGGMYHAMEIFNSFYNTQKLTNKNIKTIDQSFGGWTRIAQWLPWLEMGDKPGLMIFNASVFNTFEREEIPAKLIKIIKERYPNYLNPPPLNDQRPNETSWTVFKNHTDNNINQ